MADDREKSVYDWTLRSPESLGISSRRILALLEDLQERELTVHSMMIMRHGYPAAEVYYSPWKQDTLQRLYSSSKSFAALAILLLADEGKLQLQDPIYRFFPEIPEETIHPWTKGASIEDALTMQLPFSAPAYAVTKDANWISAFFRVKPDHPAGMLFYYDTAAAQMLAEIVKRVTGKPFYVYLRDRVNIQGYLEHAACVQAPDGSEFAGSGLRCTLRDFALTAEMLCAGGKLGDRQVLSAELAEEAIRPHSVNHTEGNATMSTKGYGYQIWCGRDCFMLKGMATQFAVCFPKQGLTFVLTCNTRGDGAAYEIAYTALKHHLLDTMHDAPLPEDPEAEQELRTRSEQMTASVIHGAAHSGIEKEIAGKDWILTGNIRAFTAFELKFAQEQGLLTYHNEWGEHEIHFGYGERVPFLFREHHDPDEYIGASPVDAYTCYGTGCWKREDTLQIKVEFEGMFMGQLILTLAFRSNETAVHLHHNIDFFPDRWFLKHYEGFDGGKA